MALDHSRLGLENKFLENKSGRIFLRSTGLLYKFLPTNLRVCKPAFYTFYTSHLRWNSTFYHTDLGQNTAFHNFSIFRTINRGLLTKAFKKFLKSKGTFMWLLRESYFRVKHLTSSWKPKYMYTQKIANIFYHIQES